jgi:hypothetical protein
VHALPPVPDEREELAALHETALGLIERLDLGELLEAIVDRAGTLVGTPHGYLYVAARARASLACRTTRLRRKCVTASRSIRE